MEEHFVYIIRSISNRSNFTKGKGPWEMVIFYQVKNKSEASLLERKLKKMKNSEKAIKYLKKLNSEVEHSDL